MWLWVSAFSCPTNVEYDQLFRHCIDGFGEWPHWTTLLWCCWPVDICTALRWLGVRGETSTIDFHLTCGKHLWPIVMPPLHLAVCSTWFVVSFLIVISAVQSIVWSWYLNCRFPHAFCWTGVLYITIHHFGYCILMIDCTMPDATGTRIYEATVHPLGHSGGEQMGIFGCSACVVRVGRMRYCNTVRVSINTLFHVTVM